LRVRALAMLARREYSRHELATRLAPFAADSAEVPALLDDFERRGWLSEERVVEQVVAARRRRFGAGRISFELRGKGISQPAIAVACEQLKESELDAARAVWQRKFGKRADSATGRARQIRFLQGRGFALETVLRVIKVAGDDE
jgi:regulatory protein